MDDLVRVAHALRFPVQRIGERFGGKARFQPHEVCELIKEPFVDLRDGVDFVRGDAGLACRKHGEQAPVVANAELFHEFSAGKAL